MSNNSTTNSQPVDLAALYDSVSATIKDSSSKEVGKYLTWSYIREDVVLAIKFLCEQRGGQVETGVVRQFLVAILSKKIENLPAGGTKVTDMIGTVRVECTQKEYKIRKEEQLKASAKSSNSGPTITRLLGNPGCRKWLLEKHNIRYDGMWTVAKSVASETKE
jgi:hypothetical protein